MSRNDFLPTVCPGQVALRAPPGRSIVRAPALPAVMLRRLLVTYQVDPDLLACSLPADGNSLAGQLPPRSTRSGGAIGAESRMRP